MSVVDPDALVTVGQQTLDKSSLRSPSVWLLLDDRPGHVTQVIGLAEALDWSYEAKTLHFTWLNRLSNQLLGASVLALDTRRSATLEPPWPDLVIAMGRRSAPVARWIKLRSGNRTRLVQLGRKAANVADHFDLAVTCAHFQLPDHTKRLQVLLPPTQVNAARLQEAAARWSGLFGDAARPRVALLVGGSTADHRLTTETALRMAAEVQSFADTLGGSLTCITSRRSVAAVEAALRQGAPRAALHCWRPDQAENPYLGYLAQADVLVVTGESESMLAEAAAAAKPLYVYPIPARATWLRARFAGWVLARARGGHGVLAKLCEDLIQQGGVLPPRDLDLMHQRLCEVGLARLFSTDSASQESRPVPDQAELMDRVRRILEQP